MKPSVPARFVIEKLYPKYKYKSILDYGCGKGMDAESFRALGIKTIKYDPYYTDAIDEIFSLDHSVGRFDLVTCTYVLNVLFPIERKQVLEKVLNKVKIGGHVLISIRSNLKIKNKWIPYDDGYITQSGTFQVPINTKELAKVIVEKGFVIEHFSSSKILAKNLYYSDIQTVMIQIHSNKCKIFKPP